MLDFRSFDAYNEAPSLAELVAQGKLPPVEGESFLPLLESEPFDRRKAIFWEHEGNCAVRMGRWKLVSQYPSKWELYDMNEDRTELTDVAASHPQRVEEMAEAYRRWADRCGVLLWEETQGYLWRSRR